MTDKDFVFIYAAVPKTELHKVKFPEGSFGKALSPAPLSEFADNDYCKKVGALVSTALNRLGKKHNPIIQKV